MAGSSLCEQGIYVWLLKRSSLRQLPITFPGDLIVVVNDNEYYILYIGIAPEREGLTSSITSRLIRSHINGNIYSSTFRYSVAAMLGLQFHHKTKVRKNGRSKTAYYLAKEDEKTLSEFLVQHCEVSIVKFDRPWEAEKDIIFHYAPPLNIEHNKEGWHYKAIKGFRRISRVNSIPVDDLFR